MDKLISSRNAAEIFRRIGNGQPKEAIARDLDIRLDVISKLISNVAPSLLPKISRRKSPVHKLTQEDKKKGGSASQYTRRAQREKLRMQLLALIDLSDRSLHAAAIAYVLLHGSPKEFLVTVPNEIVGTVFLIALTKMDVPTEAIHFQWRSTAGTGEEKMIRSDWGRLGETIEFAATGNIKSLRLRVSKCTRKWGEEEISVSSRGLAQAFLSKGKEAINEAAS